MAGTIPLPDGDADVGDLGLDVDMRMGMDEEPSLPPSCLVGEVELVRKRLTRDGRVKLKMTLFGVAVEKCAICMTQFKGGDVGILGATCHHAWVVCSSCRGVGGG